MKRIAFITVACLLLIGCKNEERIPDVSHIKVDLPVQRFENDFFSLNLNNLSPSLDTLYQKHPAFFQDFLSVIMAYESTDTAFRYIPVFIQDSLYHAVYKDAQTKYASFNAYRKEVERGLQFVKHYFPKYNTPNGIITFIGPIDGIATGITTDQKFAIGLQAYLGREYPAYHTAYVANTYPAYKTRKFEPPYIAVNCMMSVIDEIYPARFAGRPLLEQMVESGKKLYVLDKILPETEDTLITGYTKAQLDAAYENESAIWGHFLNNNLLYTTDPVTARDYMNEAPFTNPLGRSSPGYIGQFVGWQIVKKWMQQKERTLEELLQTPAKQIFDEAKYKPG